MKIRKNRIHIYWGKISDITGKLINQKVEPKVVAPPTPPPLVIPPPQQVPGHVATDSTTRSPEASETGKVP